MQACTCVECVCKHVLAYGGGVQGHTCVPGHIPSKVPQGGDLRGCQPWSKVQLEAEHPWEAGRLPTCCCTAPVAGRDLTGSDMEKDSGQCLPRKGTLA